MTELGLIITALIAAMLVVEFLRHRKRRLPAYGWVGVVVLTVAEIRMFRGAEPVSTYFTPIAWTSYIMIADAAVLAISGRSRLHDEPREFVQTTVLSIPLWLIFEAYNLRLKNWTYVGLPMNRVELLFGYAWAFATIFPGIFETADLIACFGGFGQIRPLRFSAAAKLGMVLFGAACLIIPVVVPQHVAAYLFGLVWIGFVFLLDPINERLGIPSLLSDFSAGRPGRFWSLMIAGWVCGWFWEFWNFWASSKWLYISPILQRWKIFEMPAPGYLGFMPFALECFVMYVTASWLLQKLGLR